MKNNEASLAHQNDTAKGYEIALAANVVFDLRKEKEAESAQYIADLLAHNSNPMRESVKDALKEATITRNYYTQIFDGLVEAAAVFMPANHVLDENEIVISATTPHACPPPYV
jgi:UDP-N-acetyl-D-mannosaminuronic acid transferase (WecB/TagA/CpsF family)